MSIFIELSGNVQKDKAVLANIRRALGPKVYDALREDALRLGESGYSLLAVHGYALGKKDWDKLNESEQLRFGALFQKLWGTMHEAAHAAPPEPGNAHGPVPDGSITITIPAWAVNAVKAAFPMVLDSVVKHSGAGQAFAKGWVTGAGPDFVPTPVPPTNDWAPPPGMGFNFDKMDEEVKKILDEEQAAK